MTRKKKPSGRLGRGPFTYNDFATGLGTQGYAAVNPGAHENWEHPKRPGKVQLSSKWTGVKVGSTVWRGVLLQSGYTKKQLLRILNGLAPDDA